VFDWRCKESVREKLSVADPNPAEMTPGRLRCSQIDRIGEEFGFRLLDQGNMPIATVTSAGKDRTSRLREILAHALGNATIAETASSGRFPLVDSKSRLEPLLIGEPAHHGRFRRWTYTLLEEGQLESLAGRFIEIFLIVLIVANVVAVALETIPSVNARFHSLFLVFEEFSVAAYTLEYAARLWSATEDPRVAIRGAVRGRLLFALQPLMVIDFLAFAPGYLGIFFGIDLRVLRIFRLFRLLKLARYSQALQALLGVLLAERSALFASGILLLATMCFYGELMHLAEGSVQPHTLGTMPDAMYWALTTLTTVGYGDIAPVTSLGKVIACATMVTGLALFALPVGIIANGFVTGLSRRRFAITWSMLRRQPLFQGFDIESLNEIRESPMASIVRQHAHITIGGKAADEFYLVVAGQAYAESGDETLVFGPGGMIGAESLYHSAVYGLSVTAQTDIRLIVFSGDELRRLCRKYPPLQQRIEHSLTNGTLKDETTNLVRRLTEVEAENVRLNKALSSAVLDRLVLRQD
jgi:voltage-gated potassium channel